MKLFLTLTMFATAAAVAAETAPVQAMKDMEGVYKHRFMNGIVTTSGPDEKYESEDVVEIVRYDDTHIYVRAELQFYNGHSCSIAGMAGYEQGRFVYHDPEKSYDGGPSCTLAVASSKGGITLTDRLTPDGAATCRSYCGARGSLSDYAISKRRPIRYMDRLLQSREYQKAIDDLKRYEASRPGK